MPHTSRPTPRSREQRLTNTLAMLQTPARDAWVATASTSADGTPVPYLVLRPRHVQAWREVDETAGRTLMRDGEWL